MLVELAIILVLTLFLLYIYLSMPQASIVTGVWVDNDGNIYTITNKSIKIGIYDNEEYEVHDRDITIIPLPSMKSKKNFLLFSSMTVFYVVKCDIRSSTASIYNKDGFMADVAKNSFINLDNR